MGTTHMCPQHCKQAQEGPRWIGKGVDMVNTYLTVSPPFPIQFGPSWAHFRCCV